MGDVLSAGRGEVRREEGGDGGRGEEGRLRGGGAAVMDGIDPPADEPPADILLSP